jgi:hypothetical protein
MRLVPCYLPFLLRACVSADAAAAFSSADDLGFLRTLDAAEAAFADVCSLSCFRVDCLPAIRTFPGNVVGSQSVHRVDARPQEPANGPSLARPSRTFAQQRLAVAGCGQTAVRDGPGQKGLDLFGARLGGMSQAVITDEAAAPVHGAKSRSTRSQLIGPWISLKIAHRRPVLPLRQ